MNFSQIGVSQLGIRKKILDGIHSVHKKDWDNASLPTMHYNKQVSCGEALAMVANISKHIKYICTTMAYLQNQLSRSPAILEQLQDGTGPKQLHKHTVDTIHNLTSLQTQLGTLKLQLEQMLEKGNYDPPDLIHAPPPTSNSRRRLVPMVILSGALLVTLVWNKDAISQWIGREPS
ncbi:uncharacterized protein LOC128220361 [Mya arenaria]|uniref:uncharacterized protein LOC128219105 n=1 Tax=Mya arenaria TaxID=6604 RepID=UPI0022E8777A|nr:uncharacterized protein LOC128219105 [Mya arenaria]XP_052784683.1 uncharacterized protein LOC128220361 [Mya arenaria]